MRYFARNISNDGDYIVVNYKRDILGKGRFGFVSPLAPHDAEADTVLIMDTAAHKSPSSWNPVRMLFNVMDTLDPESQLKRGFVEIKAVR